MPAKYESSFTVNVTGETTGEVFPGVFKVKTRLSFRDALERDKIRRALLGSDPDGASIRANSIADVFSELAVRIVDAPSWWANSANGMDLSDDNVVAEVYKQAMEAAKASVAEVTTKADAAKKDLAEG
jgi:hypothetical protein